MNEKEIRKIVEEQVNASLKKFFSEQPSTNGRECQGDNEEEWITCEEAAKLLKCSQGTLRRKRNLYPHQRRGTTDRGRLMFLKSGLLLNFFR